MKQKVIAFVVNVDWFFVSHRLPIALKAIEDGFDVHLITTFTNKRQYLESYGIICHEVIFSRSGSGFINEIRTVFSLRSVLSKITPDIVHSITIKPVIYSGFSLNMLRIKPGFVCAISGLGYVFSSSTIRAKVTKSLVSFMYRWALLTKRKLVIFQNTSDEFILSKIVNLSDSERVLIKGSGADLSVYNFQEEPVGSKKIVSMACRLLKEKGVYQFAEAAKLVKEKMPEVEFVLIGNVDTDNPNSVSQRHIDAWVDEGVINALGHRDDIPQLFSKSHIITLPSYYGEGVPKVLIEAAACGRPIVTTDNPGCKDAIVNGKTGLLVPVKDSAALASALFQLLNDDSRRAEMGVRAREYAVKEFDIVNVVSRHLEIYRSLIEKSE